MKKRINDFIQEYIIDFIIVLIIFSFFLGLTLVAFYLWKNPLPIEPNAEVIEISANKYTETYASEGVPLRSTIYTVIACVILTITVPLYFLRALIKKFH